MYDRQHTKPSRARLGVTSHIDTLATSTFTAKKLITGKFSEPEIVTLDDRYPDGVVYITWQAGPSTDGKVFQDMPGLKTYEYTNHLGNVLMTTSDKKLPDYRLTLWCPFITGSLDGWVPNYGGVGVTLDNTNNELQIATSLQFRGAERSFATDPGRIYEVKMNIANGMSGSIGYGVSDGGGQNIYYATTTQSGLHTFRFQATTSTSYLVAANNNPSGIGFIFSLAYVTVNEVNYVADVRSTVDYYPYGMPMVGRNFDLSDYRFGFNNQEWDNEIQGNGNRQDYGMRGYDNRLGRFLSIDPLTHVFAYYSPYIFAGNSPIAFIDLDGLQRVLAITFNGEVNYRGDFLRIINGSEISKKILTTNPADQLAQAFIEASNADENGIGFVAIWGHGDPHSMWGDQSEGISIDDLKVLEDAIKKGKVKFSENAIIYIGNCNAGTCTEEGGSFAQQLADITGVTVVAGGSDEYFTDNNRDHRGSIGVIKETTEDMQYSMWWQSLDNFSMYKQGSSPTTIGSTISIANLLTRAKTVPVEKMPVGRVEQIGTKANGNVTVINRDTPK